MQYFNIPIILVNVLKIFFIDIVHIMHIVRVGVGVFLCECVRIYVFIHVWVLYIRTVYVKSSGRF